MREGRVASGGQSGSGEASSDGGGVLAWADAAPTPLATPEGAARFASPDDTPLGRLACSLFDSDVDLDAFEEASAARCPASSSIARHACVEDGSSPVRRFASLTPAGASRVYGSGRSLVAWAINTTANTAATDEEQATVEGVVAPIAARVHEQTRTTTELL